MQRNNWEHRFEGRQQELEWLKHQWQEVKRGRPKLITILGETGLGKTRLAQELFSYLSKDESEDPQGYWPANLEIDRNLSINPDPDSVNTDVDIPWLWWGMRFAKPEDRNQVAPTSPFVNQDPNLAVHANPILRMRKQKQVVWEAGLSFTTIIADIFSVGLYGSLLTVKGMMEDQKSYIENSAIPIDAILAKQLEEIVEQTVTTLSLFLKPSEIDAPTVPVVMLLDDAQWIDSVSFQAINILMDLAVKEKLPLLILCTHWQKEWNEYTRLDIYSDQYLPESLKQLGDILNHQIEGTSLELPLKKLYKRDLEPTVESALPGIGEANQQQLLMEADGNPRALEEMIRLLLSDASLYFQNGDVQAELSKKGQKFLSKIHATDIHWLVTKRFKKLEAQLRDLLSTGALIGSEFLKPLVVDLLLASEEHPYQHFDDLDLLVGKAKNIHSLIQGKSRQIEEFQQNIYYSVAFKFLKDDDEDCYSELLKVQHGVYQQWLKPEKFNQLAANERRQTFELILNFACAEAQRYFSPKDLANAFEDIYKHFVNKREASNISAWWKKLIQMPQDWLISFAVELRTSQRGLLTYLSLETEQIVLVLPFLEKLKPKLVDIDQTSILNWHLIMGNIYRDFTSNIEAAQFHYQKNLSVLRARVVNIDNASIDDLEALSECLHQFAISMLDVNFDTETALSHFNESLNISRYIVAKFGVTAERLRSMCHSLAKVADFSSKRQIKSVKSAEAHYKELLQIRREIVLQFGTNAERQYDISDTLSKIGYLTLQFANDNKAAKNYLNESLQIKNNIVDQYGASLNLLHGIFTDNMKLGDVALHLSKESEACKDFKAAQAHYKEALKTINGIVEQFGVTKSRLNLFNLIFAKLSHISSGDISDDINAARAQIAKAIKKRRDIVDQSGTTFEGLMDISLSLKQLGNLALKAPIDVKSSEVNYKEALEVAEEIIEKYGPSDECLNNSVEIYKGMAMVCEFQKKFEESESWKRKAEAQLKLVRQHFDY